MAEEISFTDFVRGVFPNRDADDNILKEEVRIFIWNLIDKVQNVHRIGECFVKINSKKIFVRDNIPFLTANTIEFTEETAISNYNHIHQLLTGKLFRNMVIPNCMGDFLGLLIDRPLENGYLIARHCSILPVGMHISFVSGLIECPASLDNAVRQRYYDIIDSAIVEGDWSKGIEDDNFFLTQLRSRNYHSSCPFMNTYTLLKFIRDCVEHAGDARRTEFRDTSIYNEWIENQGGNNLDEDANANAMDDYVYNDNRKRKVNKTQFQLLRLFYDHFPDVLVEIQHELFENGYLAYLSIHPCDETYH